MAPIVAIIVFDKPSGVYYAGEIFSGRIVARYERPIIITEVKIQLEGKCDIEWIKNEGSAKYPVLVKYSNIEKYIDQEIVLLQSTQAETFAAGEHYYPFSIKLPANLPETFKGINGELKYNCNASVKSSATVSSDGCRPFIVHALVPLPSDIFQMKTEVCTKQLPFCVDCCCCFTTGNIIGTMTIDKGGYIPGQSILFNAEISNKSTSRLENIKLSMKQLVVYISSENKTDKSTTDIVTHSGNNLIPAGRKLIWPVALQVPEIPPTNLGTCKIITLDYYLELEVGESSRFCAPDVHFRIPFMIGSVKRK